ncbi:MAG TPA: ribonuclease J [Rickettsiales bacterium]|nr:ribonuclease J [Rickettsiales bacterium]
MTFNIKEYADELLFIPLGGSNEIGMNLNLYAYKGKFIMIDLGIGFADSHIPGVDILLPDITFISKYKKDLLGIVLTHAHEDHLGAVPYLWEELGCPLYATPFTMAVLKAKLADEGLHFKMPVHEVRPGQKIQLDPFEFEMIPLTHSIPEMQAIALRTDKGVVMHTGDWKLDPAPLVGPVTDEVTLRKYGDEGVLAMVCDSTNVFSDGTSGSEEGVQESLQKIIADCKNRVIVTTFASNIARLESIIKAGQAAGRHVAIAGRSLRRVINAAVESGYLQDINPLLGEREIGDVAKNDILVICTGCQGEPLAALSKVARGEHPNIRLSPGDTVIFSSRKIPGNETKISYTCNALTLRGIEVITEGRHHVHVSGHPCRDELTAMYQMVRPQIAVPTHGEARHIHEHAKLARSLQVTETVEARNGSVILLAQGRAMEIAQVQSGYIAVDGNSLIAADSPIIRTRRKIREDGCVVASLVINKDNELMAEPRISAPGSLDQNEDKDLFLALRDEIDDVLSRMRPKDGVDKITDAVRTAIRKLLRDELGKKPVLDVHVLKV